MSWGKAEQIKEECNSHEVRNCAGCSCHVDGILGGYCKAALMTGKFPSRWKEKHFLDKQDRDMRYSNLKWHPLFK